MRPLADDGIVPPLLNLLVKQQDDKDYPLALTLLACVAQSIYFQMIKDHNEGSKYPTPFSLIVPPKFNLATTIVKTYARCKAAFRPTIRMNQVITELLSVMALFTLNPFNMTLVPRLVDFIKAGFFETDFFTYPIPDLKFFDCNILSFFHLLMKNLPVFELKSITPLISYLVSLTHHVHVDTTPAVYLLWDDLSKLLSAISTNAAHFGRDRSIDAEIILNLPGVVKGFLTPSHSGVLYSTQLVGLFKLFCLIVTLPEDRYNDYAKKIYNAGLRDCFNKMSSPHYLTWVMKIVKFITPLPPPVTVSPLKSSSAQPKSHLRFMSVRSPNNISFNTPKCLGRCKWHLN